MATLGLDVASSGYYLTVCLNAAQSVDPLNLAVVDAIDGNGDEYTGFAQQHQFVESRTKLIFYCMTSGWASGTYKFRVTVGRGRERTVADITETESFDIPCM